MAEAAGPALPIVAYAADIRQALCSHSVIIVAGSTGSGKTTQLTQWCLQWGRGETGLIGHTQPRRIAARAVAERIAVETKTALGSLVGYQVRFSDRTSPQTKIKVMTDGILLAQMAADPLLRAYDTLIIDEAHERSLNIDFILGYLKQLVLRRSDLKVIITSATIEVEKFSKHFQHAPIIEVSGQRYPIEVHYLSEQEAAEPKELSERILHCIESLSLEQSGDILVFLPGERDIIDAEEVLLAAHLRHTEILPLYGRLSVEKQHRIFQSSGGRRIILATNVAETSLTVPNIKTVIDSGLARISRYNTRLKVQQLPIEPISKASAEQRKGRCGRTRQGSCYRLYTQADFLGRDDYTEPEMRRSNLASVLLKMAYLKLGDVVDFPFLSSPETRSVQDGVQLLKQLGAFDARGQLTSTGRAMAKLPFDPRLSRVLLAAQQNHCLAEMSALVAFLSIPDPKERPQDQIEQARARHQFFTDNRSDFVSALKLYKHLMKERGALSQKGFKQYCLRQFINYRRWCDWLDVEAQIREFFPTMAASFEFPTEDVVAHVHQALLRGFFDCVGRLQETGEYEGPRGIRFYIFPASALKSKPPRWIMSFGFLHTSKVFAPLVAPVLPEWIEAAAEPWLKRRYDVPLWEAEKGRVSALERSSLFGLELIADRRIPYASFDPALCRQLLIQEGLISGQVPQRLPFLEHNWALCAEIVDQEDRLRSRDLLISESEMAEFYARKLPETIIDWSALVAWLKTVPAETLLFQPADLYRRDPRDDLANFPTHLVVKGQTLPLRYHFEPGHPADGVTVILPRMAIKQFKTADFDWLVPGLLAEKVAALIKALPKVWRKVLSPAAAFAQTFMESECDRNQDLAQVLSQVFHRITGVLIPEEAWQRSALPPHLQMRFEILEADQSLIEATRCLERPLFTTVIPVVSVEAQVWKDFPSQNLPESEQIQQQGVLIECFIALDRVAEGVAIGRFEDKKQAMQAQEQALVWLWTKGLKVPPLMKTLYRKLPLSWDYTLEQLTQAVFTGVVQLSLRQPCWLIRTYEAFQAEVPSIKQGVSKVLEPLLTLLIRILTKAESLEQLWAKKKPLLDPKTRADMQQQWAELFRPAFWLEVPLKWLYRYETYLEAMGLRIEKAVLAPAKEQSQLALLHPLIAPVKASGSIEWRFLLEECRITLFAERLKTIQPISPGRLQKMMEKPVAGYTLIELCLAVALSLSIIGMGLSVTQRFLQEAARRQGDFHQALGLEKLYQSLKADMQSAGFMGCRVLGSGVSLRIEEPRARRLLEAVGSEAVWLGPYEAARAWFPLASLEPQGSILWIQSTSAAIDQGYPHVFDRCDRIRIVGSPLLDEHWLYTVHRSFHSVVWFVGQNKAGTRGIYRKSWLGQTNEMMAEINGWEWQRYERLWQLKIHLHHKPPAVLYFPRAMFSFGS